jgi:hypothetical protein
MTAAVAQPVQIAMNRLDNRPVELGAHKVNLPTNAVHDKVMQDLLRDGVSLVGDGWSSPAQRS